MKRHVLIFLAALLVFLNVPNATAQYVKLYDFDISTSPDGFYPMSGFVTDGAYLYSNNYSGGLGDVGTIFKIFPDGSGYEIVHDFNYFVDGGACIGDLLFDGTWFYGMSQWGGVNDKGAIFKIKPDGTGFQNLFDFDDVTTGREGVGALVTDGTWLYGMCLEGGVAAAGTIFRIMQNGSGFSILHDFDWILESAYPWGSLFLQGGKLYGMTSQYGPSGAGSMFEMNPDGTGYNQFYDFDGLSGGYPTCAFISDGTWFYGTTCQGGAFGGGVIFKIKPDGSGFEKLHDFDGTNGRMPMGTLVLEGTTLYGMTCYGGSSDLGTVFQIFTDGTGFVKMLDFDGPLYGSRPNGALYSDGSTIYGTTQYGGVNDLGVVFKFGIVANGMNENTTCFEIFPNPTDDQFQLRSTTVLTNATIVVTDLAGSEIFRRENVSLNLGETTIIIADEWSEGAYLLTVSSVDEVLSTQKLFVAGD